MLVLAKKHVTIEEYLTGNVWVEIGKIWAQILREYRRPEDGFNISINVGYLGGQRIDDTHSHGIPREAGRPSTGMGLKLLTERFDGLAVDVREFAERYCAPEARDELLSIVARATKL